MCDGIYEETTVLPVPASVPEALEAIKKNAAGEGNYIVEGEGQSFHINVRVVKKP